MSTSPKRLEPPKADDTWLNPKNDISHLIAEVTPDKRVESLEHFANIEHERWSRWQSWCHKILRENCPSPELEKVLERWDRQINTPYAELSEAEKEKDREQVRPYLEHITQYHQDLMSEIIKDVNQMWVDELLRTDREEGATAVGYSKVVAYLSRKV